jgi:hypothetical protein
MQQIQTTTDEIITQDLSENGVENQIQNTPEDNNNAVQTDLANGEQAYSDQNQDATISDDGEKGEVNEQDANNPNPTTPNPDEVLQQEEEQKKQQELEWRRKQEEGKLAKIQQELKLRDEALNYAGRLNSDTEAIQALNELISDPAKFNQLKPELDKSVPLLRGYTYDSLVDELRKNYAKQATTDPQQIQNLIQLEAAKIAAQEKKKAQEQIETYQATVAKQNVLNKVSSEIPEFKSYLESDPQNADNDFFDAVQRAQIDALRLTRQNKVLSESDEIQLIINALYEFNPTWKQNKQANKQAQLNAKNQINQMVKGAGVTTTTTSSDNELNNLSASDRSFVNQMYNYYLTQYNIDTGKNYTASEARTKALSALQS